MTRRGTYAVLAGCCGLALVACGHSTGQAPGAAVRTGFTDQGAAAVLAAFDQADSAASSAGDLTALAGQEVDPALRSSLAAVHRARAQNVTQPAFQHSSPAFALPDRAADCFVVAATLRSSGGALARTDVSQFVRTPDGRWKLSHNVQVGQGVMGTIRAIGGRPALPTAQAVAASRRDALSAEVFARTTGGRPTGDSVVTASVLLDQQFAAGWQIYQQQMAAAGMVVSRRLSTSDWSACAVPVAGGTLTFLTLAATDTIAPRPGGPTTVTLPAASPDMVGTGQRASLRGRQIAVSRVDVFLLLVPPTGAASVLGLSDAPVSITATG
jgi:hypothetical protein